MCSTKADGLNQETGAEPKPKVAAEWSGVESVQPDRNEKCHPKIYPHFLEEAMTLI